MLHFQARQRLRRQLKTLRPELYRLAWSWCQNAAVADDLVQETCLRALERADQLRDPARLKGWLVRILVNLHTDLLRQRRETEDVAELPCCAGNEPDLSAERQDTVQRVRQAICRLSEDQRRVLTLVDLMEMSYAEVAEALDIPIGTVMSRLSRARKRLRLLLQSEMETAAAPTRLRRIK